MARWCLRNDYALNDDEIFNFGCTDEWGTHHQCEGCPHNRYMGDGKQYQNLINNYGNDLY